MEQSRTFITVVMSDGGNQHVAHLTCMHDTLSTQELPKLIAMKLMDLGCQTVLAPDGKASTQFNIDRDILKHSSQAIYRQLWADEDAEKAGVDKRMTTVINGDGTMEEYTEGRIKREGNPNLLQVCPECQEVVCDADCKTQTLPEAE